MSPVADLVFLLCCFLCCAQVNAASHCCAPSKFSAKALITSIYHATGRSVVNHGARHYDGDAKRSATILMTGPQVADKSVHIDNVVYYRFNGACYVWEEAFEPACVPDTFQQIASSEEGGSGDGLGDGDDDTIYRHEVAHPLLGTLKTTDLHVDKDCLVTKKIVEVTSATGYKITTFISKYTYDTVGSLSLAPAVIFQHCIPAFG